METYLYHVKKSKYRITNAKFRLSSHTLKIERGRHTKPKTPDADQNVYNVMPIYWKIAIHSA